MVETTAAAPRMHWGVGRIGLGVGAGFGLALVSFASGGYFPTAWAWGALVALTVVAAFLVLGDVVRPSSLALTSLGGLTGLAAWTWLGLIWSDVASATVLEGLRMLLYVSVLAALVLIVRRATVSVLLWASFRRGVPRFGLRALDASLSGAAWGLRPSCGGSSRGTAYVLQRAWCVRRDGHAARARVRRESAQRRREGRRGGNSSASERDRVFHVQPGSLDCSRDWPCTCGHGRSSALAIRPQRTPSGAGLGCRGLPRVEGVEPVTH